MAWMVSIGAEEANLPHLSATVLDRGLEDLNNLYKTISRKRILSKASAAASTLHLAYSDRRTGFSYTKRSWVLRGQVGVEPLRFLKVLQFSRFFINLKGLSSEN
jgi:hypothetical protein